MCHKPVIHVRYPLILYHPIPFPELPYNDYFEYFGPDFKLHISPTNMSNQNTPEYLNKIKSVDCW